MFTCTPSASNSDATIGPTAATTIRLKPLKQVCVSAGSTGYIAKGARKGDRVELAGSHIVDDVPRASSASEP
jgi:hypothetical protein